MKFLRGIAATALIIAGAPRAALACPVCFGDANAPMTIAATNGIWFMLAVVAAMLTAFASFFVYLMRRARLAARMDGPADAQHMNERWSHRPRHRSADHGQEGTAQC